MRFSVCRDPVRRVRERLRGRAAVRFSVCRNLLCCVRECLGRIDGPGRDGELETTSAKEGIPKEELKAKWMYLVDLLKNEGINIFNPDSALDGALCIR